MYTYAPNQLEEVYDMRNDGCCTGVKMESLNRKSSSVKGRGSSRLDTISFSRKVSLPSEKVKLCCLNFFISVWLFTNVIGDHKLLKSYFPFPESHFRADWYSKCHAFFAWICSRSPKEYTSEGRKSQLLFISDIFVSWGFLNDICILATVSTRSLGPVHVIGAIIPSVTQWFRLKPT